MSDVVFRVKGESERPRVVVEWSLYRRGDSVHLCAESNEHDPETVMILEADCQAYRNVLAPFWSEKAHILVDHSGKLLVD